ncbi:hypothetical protein F2Q70_00014980 [Brassica cretica]|uniref:Phospholipase D C-terminal domain-containing protein n=1 Tax=Brassica cretica TaxID=69181 RepID=A0A8S9HQV2_BRACR|nr:hypothetical protein F2Q70_00014980 [Brassica cretica]
MAHHPIYTETLSVGGGLSHGFGQRIFTCRAAARSVKGFPKDPKEASGRNLLCGKNILIDMSIHAAYVKAIRSAQHFIYIVNQYFLGSSFNWDSNKDLGANNLIPIEMALKIANKIRAREKFAAYIVIPMWPEAQNHANDVSNHPQGTCGSWT